jgi:hypothetical protein
MVSLVEISFNLTINVTAKGTVWITEHTLVRFPFTISHRTVMT